MIDTAYVQRMARDNAWQNASLYGAGALPRASWIPACARMSGGWRAIAPNR